MSEPPAIEREIRPRAVRPSPSPLGPPERIPEVDVVRGFALFGVLLVNLYSFGADSVAWNTPLDRLAFGIKHVFFDSKSWSLFSLLFGFGLTTQLGTGGRQKGFGFLVRRMGFLFVLGMAHALLYEGDVLMLYAQWGCVLWIAVRWRMRTRFVLALCLLAIFPVAHLAGVGRFEEDGGTSVAAEDARNDLLEDRAEHVYAIGTLRDVLAYNAEGIPENPFEEYAWPDSGFAIFALFLLGSVVATSGVLRDIEGHRRLFRRVRQMGWLVGLAAMTLERTAHAVAGYDPYRPQEAGPATLFAGDLLFVVGTVALAVAYAATLVLATRTPTGRRLLAPLAPVGRLALTGYLVQTLLFTFFFHGYGLGWAYRVGPFAVTLLAVAIFSAQVVICNLWVRAFRFGPAEWLWRSFTYLGRQPMRRSD